jgi:hypothetical protein
VTKQEWLVKHARMQAAIYCTVNPPHRHEPKPACWPCHKLYLRAKKAAA